MKNFIKVIAGVAILSATACSDAPIAVTATDICNEEFKNVLVTTEGTIQLPDSFYSAGGSVTMLLETPKGKFRAPAIKIKTFNKDGEKKNMMEQLKDGFTEADVKIYDDKGQIVKLGDKIRVTGEVVGASKAWCDINVEKIEKIN